MVVCSGYQLFDTYDRAKTSETTVIRWLYNRFFDLGLMIAAPFYFLKLWRRGGWREDFGQRWGRYNGILKQTLTNREIIWLHAVSVGEVNLCLQLIAALQHRLPFHKIVVSTTTSTGMAELKKRLPGNVSRIYYPIDRHRQVQRALSAIHPQVFVLIESELWPNMIWELQRQGIPYFLVNARISERSFRRYRQAGFLFRSIFNGFRGIAVQTPQDADRLIRLGVRPEALHVTGSLKFDAAIPGGKAPVDARSLLKQVGVPSDAIILIGGSTHAGEEVILARIASQLRRDFPRLFLVVVPRHHERGGEVGQSLSEMGTRFLFRSLITPEFQAESGSYDCLLVNTTGELRSFYVAADLVFIGKSLTAHGGQNPIEPAALGKAVIVGPNMENFQTIVRQFLQMEAILQVTGEAELESTIRRCLSRPDLRDDLGKKAKTVVQENQGAVNKAVEMISMDLERFI